MFKRVGVILGVIVTLATILGFGFAVDDHYAKAGATTIAIEEVQADLEMVGNRIDAMKLEDELLLVKKTMYDLEDRWGVKFKEEFGRYHHTLEELLAFMPEEYRNEYRGLVEKKIDLEKKIEEKNKKRES